MPKVLIAPLDWGLGHATRCIPLIRSLLNEGWDITLASEGNGARLLQASFPSLPLLTLPGYHIRYGKRGSAWQIIQQLPRIARSITAEHQWLHEKMQEYHWDLIISDNRPGLFHRDAYCIYITHQIRIHSGLGKWADYIASSQHQRTMKAFDEVWIPDIPGPTRLAGKLSDKSILKMPAAYIGCLSELSTSPPIQPIYDIMLLLSGPEPQRTILENICLGQIQNHSEKIILIRGTQQPLLRSDIPENIEVINLADRNMLQQKMQESAVVISRSGYTTLMDLMKMKKKALLIPTPGQGEQEYLAAYANKRGFFPVTQQQTFDLSEALSTLQTFPFAFPFEEASFSLHQKIIHELKNKIT
jgi:predicted glycosyltransferase